MNNGSELDRDLQFSVLLLEVLVFVVVSWWKLVDLDTMTANLLHHLYKRQTNTI